MNLVPLTDVPFDDKAAFMDFLLANDLEHQSIAAALLKKGKSLQVLPIDVVGDDFKAWMEVHQDRHQQEFTQLGLGQVPDMADVDFTNQQAYYDWMDFHAQIHAYVGGVLGV